MHGRQRHHHGRDALVAGRHPEHATASRQRPDLAPEDGGGVVAEGQAVEHARGSLRAAVTRIAARGGERNRPQFLQLLGRGFDQQSDLPVPRVQTERDGCPVRGAHAAVRAQNQDLLASELGRVPAHGGIHRPAEQVAGGEVPHDLGRQRERAGGARSFGADVVDRFVPRIQNHIERNGEHIKMIPLLWCAGIMAPSLPARSLYGSAASGPPASTAAPTPRRRSSRPGHRWASERRDRRGSNRL